MNLQQVSDANQKELRKLIEHLQLKQYALSTIRIYSNEFMQLLVLLGNHNVATLQSDDLKRYLLYCINERKLSENTLHSRLNALKFYYEQVLKKEQFFFSIPRPKKAATLPKFFSQEEITSIIKSVVNLKHRTMLMLCYSTGMRVSEVVNLKISQILAHRNCILIERAKGKKDRLVQLSPVLLIALRAYAIQYKIGKEGYLFPGQQKITPYSSRSLQKILQEAKLKAGIIKPGSVHALRHSFATHLLDKGTDISIIQKILGHNDIKTTLRYLHTSNRDLLKVISPLDDLDLS